MDLFSTQSAANPMTFWFKSSLKRPAVCHVTQVGSQVREHRNLGALQCILCMTRSTNWASEWPSTLTSTPGNSQSLSILYSILSSRCSIWSLLYPISSIYYSNPEYLLLNRENPLLNLELGWGSYSLHSQKACLRNFLKETIRTNRVKGDGGWGANKQF